MEIWILLAAAGSGYLAHCWQNFQKSKEASSDISDDDDDHSGSPRGTLSSRRRYCRHLSSSSRRLKARSNQNWHVSKLNDSVGKMTVGCATHLYDPIGDDEERDEAQASQTGVILDACSCSKIPVQSQAGLDAVGSYPTNTKNSMNSPPRCPALPTFDAFCALNCCGFDWNHQGRAFMSAEDSLESWYSAQCTGGSTSNASGSMLQDESPVKLLYDALDNGMASEERAFPYGGTWMLGFWNVFEVTSVLETSTSCIMREHEGRSSINTRKVRSHRKNGRSRCFTRRIKSLETRLSITSSESCSSLQYDNMYNQENIDDNTHLSSACAQPLAEAIVSDSPLSEENHGLLLSPRNEILKVLNKTRKSESLVGEKAVERAHLPCLLSQSSRIGQVKASRECSASPRGDSFLLQGTVNSILKSLLFNFGVGVGVMFTILSNRHGTKRLIEPVEATLCALKDLEEDVHGRTELMAQCYQTKDTREDAMAEQINALFKVVSRIFDVVDGVRNSLSQDLACISAMDFKHFTERARLEAELEAELERMEMNLNTGDVPELCWRNSALSEDDLKTGNLIQGELSARGLPCDTELSDDGTDSSYEVIHYGNLAVPPVELAKRLSEVLEARQEREILELKAEVKYLDGRLRAKQKELQVWKQRVLHLLQGSIWESFSSFQEMGFCVKAVETTEKVRRAEEPCHFSVGMHHSTLDSFHSLGCNEHISSNSTKEVCSLHSRVPQHKTCLMNEADDEVSEQASQLFSDTATVSPSSSPNGLFSGAHTKDNEKTGMPVSHQELESTGFLNDATDNTPCSVKFVDKHTILHEHLEDKLEHKVGMEASSKKEHSNLDWNGEVVPISKAISFTQDKPAVFTQDVIEISESYEQFVHPLDSSTSEDGSYSSDLDEKLGQLLIKRIVEKSKRGSSIVEVAQSVMASFDIDETGVT